MCACAPGICGAAAALLFLDGAWDEQDLSRLLEQRFGAGATPQDAVRFLSGLMAAAPELLLTQPGLRRSFNTLVGSWDEASFIQYSFDLRLAFTGLKPQETSDLAEALAVLNGAAPDALQAEFHYDVSEDEMLAGGRLNAALAAWPGARCAVCLAGSFQRRSRMAENLHHQELLRRWRLMLGRHAQPLQTEAWSGQRWPARCQPRLSVWPRV